MKAPSPERVAEFAAAARRLVVERVDAADLVSHLLRDTPREQWMTLADRPELHTNGALERLSREIDTALDRQPQDALLLSALAISIADSLADDQYPPVVTAQIRANAWKDRAQALSFTGRHDESVNAIDRSVAMLEHFGTVAHDRAVIHLVKAAILQNVNRFEESLALLTACRKVFRQHGDYKRLLHCGINEANLYYRHREFAKARDVFASLISTATIIADRSLTAAIHHNIACCLIELDQLTEANIHVSTAITLLNEVGNHVGAFRTELATGRLLVSRGRTTEGLLRLRSARDHFAGIGLPCEAGICALDISAALLTEGREREAREMFDNAFGEINPHSERARAALQYLANEFAAHDATPAVVHHVTQYLETLQTEPGLEFVALQ